VARALLAAGPVHYDEALSTLRKSAPYERSREFGLAPLGLRASIELSAGHPAQAAALFQEVLNLHAVAPASPWVAFARVGVARARRDAGDLQGSRTAYDAAIEWLKEGDPDAPLLVASKAERAALQD
jgi:hypothetical protein